MPGVASTDCTRKEKCHLVPYSTWYGFNLASVPGSPESCLETCTKTDNGVTFSWNDRNGGTCYLHAFAWSYFGISGMSAYSCKLDKPTNVCRQNKDVEFVGVETFKESPVSNPDGCCGLCAIRECTAYTWDESNGGTCYFKKNIGHAIYKPGAISALTTAQWGPLCPFEFDIDFVGNDIGNKPATDAADCCSKCRENKQCKAYSWNNYNGGTCWLKSSKGQAVAARGVVSAALVGF